MKPKCLYFVILVVATTLGLASCQGDGSMVQHKLIVTGNEHSVPMYPDEQTYLKVSHMQQEGGVKGMAGEVRQSFAAKDIDDQTPVSVVSSDSNGAVVEITQGPMKGQTGFVKSQNLD